MADLPYTYTDTQGDMITVSPFADIHIRGIVGGKHYVAKVNAPTGEDAAALARAILANPGSGDVRYVVAPEWQVTDPAEVERLRRIIAQSEEDVADLRQQRDEARQKLAAPAAETPTLDRRVAALEELTDLLADIVESHSRALEPAQKQPPADS